MQNLLQNLFSASWTTTSFPLSRLPMAESGIRYFELKQKKFLLVVDYCSRYVEIAELFSATSSDVIRAYFPVMVYQSQWPSIMDLSTHQTFSKFLPQSMDLSTVLAAHDFHKEMKKPNEEGEP